MKELTMSELMLIFGGANKVNDNTVEEENSGNTFSQDSSGSSDVRDTYCYQDSDDNPAGNYQCSDYGDSGEHLKDYRSDEDETNYNFPYED